MLSLIALMVSHFSYAGQVAIVIDDIGYHERDLDAINLPGEVSFSILPFTPFAKSFAQQAQLAKKEMLLHVPMQAISGKELGPGAITYDMNKEQLQHMLARALDDLPQVKGINNHMGSLLTQKIKPMSWTMEVLKERNLYFLDSKTTQHSQAQHMANLFGVDNISRHVFIDNIPSEKQMTFRMNQLIRLAKKNDYAIAIAHPYPETLAFLEQALPKLAEQGIKLVPLSDLVTKKYVRLAALTQANPQQQTQE
ncbi:divergent polysaccharide deacetylase family protein [Pseudoalteromonas tunicata]|jgi:polysaccharide deacetylase 2 family uncharacterized protein YibQ|uniref:Divergent polysaccharide deacetylase family protein n=1 Tax=Pseudoalteromonas tunicata D2 TaxID=87626 RepID=A4C7A8_9GAMM|nr:divergent polysaccharide deacetylase family protein [Pseudoalteromonas tunicata]AXT32672.1 divergent polysaccharide deacetylase family protein [Pseudoalteromonas tunicata]EAR29862.1 hypothetical protein PTD2_13619 [Pseudoalteromonas tunicata D2]